ncbi:MAG: hypothetical protein A2X67_09610 [Ignavibacteria bacterium GWA2_55_11]|nr:MAG: hypothetical protein A2X67_09610 [Ignavibacteria bacterium GWA2_55_11]OGU66816.1 MAG: hypothetical protein A3C56_00485 [Ignavibacteria bacterium RIFCSPHIGHO2_02_FULL_56_12]OGU71435.1 MAG: hypothetical protein A3G43_13085 [Ignavibacteria bacterium RIFCSPLOWO2_12_FULL_56_21]OGU74438.1 MAG: hypothetical protein A3H45_11200 [Ignavibacteria bacterium RIFCSPLOWO2_02_FULL_55_14]
MRLLKFVIIPLLMHTPLRGQCEGDLSWEYGEKKEEGFSIGQMFSNAFTPQLVIDTKEIRSYVRDARYKELTKRCGDLRAVDAIYIRSLKIAGYSIGRALLLSMMAVLEHQNLHVRIPIVSSIKLPLTLEEDSLFLQRIRHLPGRVYADSPTNGEMDKDKLQHFFASAYIAYASESVDLARGAGNIVEWGEAKFVVGGADDPRDKRANKQGELFGRDLLAVKNLLPSDYLLLPVESEE